MDLEKWGPAEILQAILIIMFGGVSVFLLATGKPVAEALWGIDGTVVGFFFLRATQEATVRQVLRSLGK